LTTDGTLSISDVDNPAIYQAQNNTAGTYGSFSIDANGQWNYVADSAHNEFIAGQTYTDTFKSEERRVSKTCVIVNILGMTDAAVLGSTIVNLTETDAVLSTDGTLSISDVDSPAVYQAQNNTAGTYGSFSIDANGQWNYVADSAHNEFVAGQTYTDTFNVLSADGTATSVIVNILGTNDAAVLGSATVNLTETDAALTTDGTLSISDVDSPAVYQAQNNTAGTYDAFLLNSNGQWNYVADSAHNEFVAGQTYTDTFNVLSADGTATSVVVNILGTNDAAVLGSATVNLTETDAVLSTDGTLSISDVDSPATYEA